MDINDLAQIISLLKQNDITEFELNQDGTHIRLTRKIRQAGAPQNSTHAELEPAITGSLNGQVSAAPEIKKMEIANNLISIKSPIVGTFYRRPSPDAEPFAQEGDKVKKGDTLCIVEAMKVMNEIESSCNGTIEKVLLGDGQVVEYGEVLFLINPV